MTTHTVAQPLVLLVDADTHQRETYAMSLRASGFAPLQAASPGKAFRIATAFLPDVIVTAALFSGAQTGMELIRRLRQHPLTRNVPVICVTGSAFGHECAATDGDARVVFLARPRLADDLVQDIQRVMSPTVPPKRKSSQRISTHERKPVMANQRRRQTDHERTAVANDQSVMTAARDNEQITDDAVRARAHELYEQRGSEHGHDWDDWFQAERELRREADRRG